MEKWSTAQLDFLVQMVKESTEHNFSSMISQLNNTIHDQSDNVIKIKYKNLNKPSNWMWLCNVFQLKTKGVDFNWELESTPFQKLIIPTATINEFINVIETE